jgi:hypothetical protein
MMDLCSRIAIKLNCAERNKEKQNVKKEDNNKNSVFIHILSREMSSAYIARFR